MKQEFYCVAVKNRIMGIDTGNNFELFFEEPSIMNLGDLVVFRGKKVQNIFFDITKTTVLTRRLF